MPTRRLVQVRHRPRPQEEGLVGAPVLDALARDDDPRLRCRLRRVERDRLRLARLGIGAEVDGKAHRRSGQEAEGAAHIGSAVVVGTGARVVNLGPSARSTVTTLRLSLTNVVPFGIEARTSLAWASPFGP